MRTRSIAALVGFLAALIGLIFLFVPVNASIGLDCGHVFGGGLTDDVLAEDSVVAACADARTDRWQYSLPLLVLGATVALCSTATSERMEGVDTEEEEGVDEAAT